MKSLKQYKLMVTLVLAATLLLGSCAKPAPDPVPGSTPTPTPTPAPTPIPMPKPTPTPAPVPTGPYGELRVAVSTFGDEKFDPVVSSTTTSQTIVVPMADWLLTADLAKGVVVTPGIVEKWEMAPDGLSWIYHIRKGIKFHNGDALTAKDVKFSLDRFASKEAFYAWLRDSISRVDLVDDYTVQIYTKGTQPYLAYLCSTPSSGGQGLVLPKNYFEGHGAEYFQRHPIGNGPFKFVRHVPGDMVEYEAVDNHWRQTPDFKKLTLVIMPEENTRIASLKTKAVDIIDVGIEGAADAKASGLKVAALSTNVDTVRIFGTYEPESASLPTADVRVRQALSLAINREEMRNTIMYGLSGPPAAGGVLFTSMDIDAAYWESYCTKLYRYDPAESKRLLNEAGYPNGFTIKIYSFAQGGAPYLPKFAEVIQGYWQKIGVNAQLTPIDYGVFQGLRKAGKNGAPAPEVLGQAALNGSSEDRLAINKILSVYTSTNRRELVGKAFPDLDKLIASAMSEMDTAKRKQYIAQALQQGLEMYVDIGVSISPQLAAIGPRVDINFPTATKTILTRVDIAKHAGQ